MMPLTASQIREQGRHLQAPFCIQLIDGRLVHIEQLLRFVPRKRIVARARLGDQVLLLKLFIGHQGQARRHSARERRGVQALAKAHCLTPAQQLDSHFTGGGIALGFTFLDDAQTLGALWQAADAPRKQMLMGEAMQWLSQLHEAGLQQKDMHFDNLLYSENRWYGIDGDGIDDKRAGRSLSPEQRLRNLGLFLAQLPPCEDVNIPAWLQCYQPDSRAPSLTPERLLAQVVAWRCWRVRRYAQKTVRSCSDFAVRKSWQQMRVLPKALNTPTWHHFLDHIGDHIQSGTPLKQGNSATVVQVNFAGKALVVKRYIIKSPWHALSRLFRPSRAWVSWKNAHRLLLLGIATPKPVALLERRYGPLRREAFLVTEYCAGISLGQYAAQENFQPQLMQSTLLPLMTHLANHRLHHGDLKASNVLLDEHNQLQLIDLDAMQQYRVPYTFRKAFARDIQRFMKNWYPQPEVHAHFLEVLKPLISPVNCRKYTEISHHDP